MATAIIGLLLIALFTALAFWKMHAVIFMLVAGLSMMLGLAIPDLITSTASTTPMDLTLGLSLVAFSWFSLACAYRMMFWRGDEECDEDD